MVARQVDTDIRAANEQFYDAFRNGDFPLMDALWSRRRKVSVLHPEWIAIEGRDDVMASWYQVLVLSEPPNVRPRHVSIIRSRKMAMVVCTEEVDLGEMVATNVFVQEEGMWLLVHHQATPLPSESDETTEDGDGEADEM
ncbi:MAG: nuclear transport factor 2 family protein [Pseudomonadota bacterium]